MKSILYCLLSVFCMYSCSTTEFSINAVVADESLNGTVVFLKERVNREWLKLDSATITDGKFSFNGSCDTAKIAYLAYTYTEGNKSASKIRQAFVLENKKLTVDVDSSGFMIFKGSKQNDLLQRYANWKRIFYEKMDVFYQLNANSDKKDVPDLKFIEEEKKLNREEVDFDCFFSAQNVNSLVGTHVFLNSFYAMSINQKQKIIHLMDTTTKHIKRIQEILTDMETEKLVSVGCQFTDFKLPTLNGDSLALSSLVGKTDFVLIDFWASWCGPCMQFLPQLKTFYQKYKGVKLQILGVSLDDDKNAWRSTINSKQMMWEQVSDLKGWKCSGSKAYAVNSIPCTVLIDKSGKIVGRNLSIYEMEKLLAEFYPKK